MKEIERKFLVINDNWREGLVGTDYRQGYLTDGSTPATCRVRIAGDRGFLTIKGPPTGISRDEFEYEIPHTDATSLLVLCTGGIIEKQRYLLPWHGLIWEIDVFYGANAGLVVAEIELQNEAQAFPHPEWLGDEVSSDPRYTNAALARVPYTHWI